MILVSLLHMLDRDQPYRDLSADYITRRRNPAVHAERLLTQLGARPAWARRQGCLTQAESRRPVPIDFPLGSIADRMSSPLNSAAWGRVACRRSVSSKAHVEIEHEAAPPVSLEKTADHLGVEGRREDAFQDDLIAVINSLSFVSLRRGDLVARS
ncbi:hypothetical protein [Frankia canadensis]|uniref:hypothetical protein n=1 Tax=Frankia canadensis TaxID=1836972 RepID=UPI001054A50E|nr:hypothetical protein [Frankia canadensis]